MALNRQQSIQLYGTEAYTGWGETEAMYDARDKGLSGGGNGNGGEFNFESEVDKAFNELGGYYTQLLDEAQGDLNLALSRLQEDYDTGKRFSMQNFEQAGKAIDLAQEAFSTDADKAFRQLKTSQLARGINRQSAFDPNGGKGIADVEAGRLKEDVASGQENLDLRKQNLDINFEQGNQLADTSLARSKVDMPTEFNRYKRDLEDRRKKEAGQLALSRQQRAYDRFESALI
jgi:hypothetical protein